MTFRTISLKCNSPDPLNLLSRKLSACWSLHVTSKFKAHCREHFGRKVVLAAGCESLVKSCAQHWRWCAFINCCGDRPAPFSGIRDAAGKLREVRFLQ